MTLLKTARWAFVALSMAAMHSVVAADSDCAVIKSDKKRLECFDAASRSAKAAATQTLSTQTSLALKALRKINSATEIGVSMRDYGQLLIEQISTIDEALRGMPNSELKDAITKSREAYVDAKTLWSNMYSSEYVSIFVQYSKATYSKYEIDPQYLDALKSATFAKSVDMDMSKILNPVWAAARASLTRAETLDAHRQL